MSKVFVIADTHFGHKNIVSWGRKQFATIEEHDRELVRRWNAVVTKHDVVWHLGDVFFTKNGHTPLADLNGMKHLVMGNHDHHPLRIYQNYFNKILGAAEYGSVILTHIPIHESQRYRWARNVHGHLHELSVPDPWYACVSCDHTNLAPIELRIAIG
jgi:calcineurin-like phosphoesterase family protein